MKSEHYFVSTVLHWEVDEDLFKLLQKHRAAHGKTVPLGLRYYVYRVPVPISEDYEIIDFVPVVEGVRLVASGSYE